MIEALPTPIEQATFAEFNATLQLLELGECRERNRRAATGVTKVEICAYQGAQYVGGAHSSHNGDIVTQLKRTGSAPDDRWQMEPAPIEYYMVVTQRQFQGKPILRYHMVKLDRAAQRITVGNAYEWAACHPRHQAPPTVARASFRDCVNGPPDANDLPKRMDTRSNTTSLLNALWPVSTAFAAPAQGVDSPEWVDCEGGCCTGGSKILSAVQ